MNRMFAAVSALALVATAAPDFTQEPGSVVIDAVVEAQCVIEGGSGSFKVVNDLAEGVLEGLNQLRLQAWPL